MLVGGGRKARGPCHILGRHPDGSDEFPDPWDRCSRRLVSVLVQLVVLLEPCLVTRVRRVGRRSRFHGPRLLLGPDIFPVRRRIWRRSHGRRNKTLCRCARIAPWRGRDQPSFRRRGLLPRFLWADSVRRAFGELDSMARFTTLGLRLFFEILDLAEGEDVATIRRQ